MKYRTARMSGLILAFGIFFSFSCSSLKTSDTTDSSVDRPNTLQSQIKQINLEIEENPGNTALKIQKADLLFRYAQSLPDPSDRKPIFKNIRDISESFTRESQESPDKLNDLLEKAWRTEHNSGFRLLQKKASESTDESEFRRITSHFENAITILPDSIKSYNLLATTHYRNGQVNKAIETLKMAEIKGDQSNPDVTEKLAYLYLETGNFNEAEKRYRTLSKNYPDEVLYRHGLINVLILSDNHEEAIQNLENLIEEYPTRYNYQQSLATEVYFLFKKKTDSLLQDAGSDLTDSKREELIDLLDSAHNIFDSLQDTLPTTEENLFRMAAFYKNTSLRLKKLSLNSVNQNNPLLELKDQYLNYALPLWEQLAEINPENLEYITNLHQVYVELGMNVDAENLKRSYNF